MTQWVEEPTAGRDRGPLAVLRAWVEVLVRPRRFFRNGVAPGDQAPGLIFAALVVFVAVTSMLAVRPDSYPVLAGQPVVSAVLWVLAAMVLVAPAAIHLTAAVQTVLLMTAVPDRAGISETVQVICYATAPCVLAGLPSPWLRSAVAVYGAGLYVLGLATVHDTRLPVALVVGFVPAVAVFGYGFGGVAALSEALDLVVSALEPLLD
ncbi:YIP1 family protein [Halobacteriales archaeon Cl-PHB]